jgi:predicted nucleotidyltransferase
MTKLLDLSEKIDALALSLYEVLTEVGSSIGLRFFVVGATARDTILELGFGIPSGRATKDVDVGVRVASWGDFDRLKEALLQTRHFARTREVLRFLYRGALPVDILPFGEIADPQGEIRWPPDHEVVMGVVGFEEAYRSALTVRVRAHPPLDVLVASPAGLAILKFTAWAERPSERTKDARDFVHILERYLDAGNLERLLEEHDDLVGVENFDYLRAGARLLGRDIASLGHPETRAKILEALERETGDAGESLLIRQIVRDSALIGEEEGRFEEVLALLNELKAGLNEG